MKCSVAGAGQWGKNLIRNASQLGILAGVFDPSSARRTEIERMYPGVPVFGSYEEMLETETDAVIIAAPANMHAELAMPALHHGKHVFVEKPLALHVGDAQAMVQTAKALSKVLFVGHLLLYHPAVTELLRQVRSGAIGEIRHVRTRRLSLGRVRAAEDVWWSFAPHDIAVLLEIFGEMPTNGSANFSAHVSPGIADFVHADFTFSGGRSAHVEVSWLDPARSQRVDVFGTTGVLTYTDDRVAGAALTRTECGVVVNGEILDTWRSEPVTLSFPSVEPLRLELEQFVRSVQTGESPITDGREGLRVVEVLSMVAPGRAGEIAMEVPR